MTEQSKNMTEQNPREILDFPTDGRDVLSLVTRLQRADFNTVLLDYIKHNSIYEVGAEIYLETPTKYWEGEVVFGDVSGVILKKVVSVQTTGESSAHYRTGPERSESLPENQMIAISSKAIIMVAPLERK